MKTTYHSALKNADIQTNASQIKSASKVYDAFGNLRTGSGSWKGQFHYGGQFGYQQDPDSGLKLLGHRYYDSSTGRFLTRDPIKDGRNWYSYCGNNPVTKYDANGLEYLFIEGDVDFAAGWGDTLAGPGGIVPALNGFDSGTKWLRHLLGADTVDSTSPGYFWGSVTGVLHSLALPSAKIGSVPRPVPVADPRLANMARGRMIHTEIQQAYKALDVGWESEYKTGKGRADLVNLATKEVIEIKPNNSQGISRGLNQLDRYVKSLSDEEGGIWTAYLITYE